MTLLTTEKELEASNNKLTQKHRTEMKYKRRVCGELSQRTKLESGQAVFETTGQYFL